MSNVLPDISRQAFAEAYWLDGSKTFKAMLLDATYVPSAAHAHVSDVVAHELDSGAHPSYSRKTLTGIAVTVSGNRANCNANNPVWALLDAGTVGAAVVFENGASDAASPIVAILDPADLVSYGVDFTLQFGGGITSGPVVRI